MCGVNVGVIKVKPWRAGTKPNKKEEETQMRRETSEPLGTVVCVCVSYTKLLDKPFERNSPPTLCSPNVPYI